MTARHHGEPADGRHLGERDLAIATLVGRYVERRETVACPRANDLLKAAAELGDGAVDELLTVLALYEQRRATDDGAR